MLGLEKFVLLIILQNPAIVPFYVSRITSSSVSQLFFYILKCIFLANALTRIFLGPKHSSPGGAWAGGLAATKLEHLSPRDYHDDWFRFLRSLANPRALGASLSFCPPAIADLWAFLPFK